MNRAVTHICKISDLIWNISCIHCLYVIYQNNGRWWSPHSDPSSIPNPTPLSWPWHKSYSFGPTWRSVNNNFVWTIAFPTTWYSGFVCVCMIELRGPDLKMYKMSTKNIDLLYILTIALYINIKMLIQRLVNPWDQCINWIKI